MSLTEYLSAGNLKSSRRLIPFICAIALVACMTLLCFALAYQAFRNWTVSAVVAGAFALVAGYVAWLSRAIFMKPDSNPPEVKP